MQPQKHWRWMLTIACTALCLGLALANNALADSTPALRNIALQSSNSLHGQVVDSEGMAQANAEVWISREEGRTTKTRTDASGRFTASDLAAGVYRIETAAGGGRFRLWNPKTAPADALSNLLLVVIAR